MGGGSYVARVRYFCTGGGLLHLGVGVYLSSRYPPIYAPISAIFCYFVHLWAYNCQLNRLSASLHTCSYQAPRPYYHIIWLHGFGVG